MVDWMTWMVVLLMWLQLDRLENMLEVVVRHYEIEEERDQ